MYLTSSMVAKISDLGNAHIVDLQPGQLARTLTRVPGTLVHMNECNFYVTPRLNLRASGQVGPCDSITHTEIVHTSMLLTLKWTCK